MRSNREVYSEMGEPKEQYSVTPPAEPPEGYLRYQAQFGEIVDSIRELTSRAIPYKSADWWDCYQCYMAGRRDEVKELREGLQSDVNADLKNRVSL